MNKLIYIAGILACLYIFMGSLIGKAFFKSGTDKLTTQVPENFFDFKVKDIDGNVVDFAQFKDRKLIMVVNVACK